MSLIQNDSPQGGDDLIKATSTEAFMADVVEPSLNTTVLVDFWSPSCGPCKELLPRLEAAVRAAGGTVKLVTLNVAEHPEIPSQMQVKSVPAVFAFKNGQPVDGFMGALPDSQLKEFIKKVGGESSADAQIETFLQMADTAVQEGEIDQAINIYSQILTAKPDELKALGGMITCYIQKGDLDLASQTLSMLDDEATNDPIIKQAAAALELAQKSKDGPQLNELETALANDPKNPQILFDYAMALNGASKKEDACKQLVALMKLDRGWQDGKAHKQLLEFFEAWGANDPATQAGRLQLSSLLFS